MMVQNRELRPHSMKQGRSDSEYHKVKPRDIGERSFEYSLDAVRLCQNLQQTRDQASLIIAKQYLRSATSIGANVQEAQSGESRSDFIHKYSIAQKEARESLYWLRLLSASGIIPGDHLAPLIRETKEIFSVITAIIINAKKRALK